MADAARSAVEAAGFPLQKRKTKSGSVRLKDKVSA
jgi:hypothetical protein